MIRFLTLTLSLRDWISFGWGIDTTSFDCEARLKAGPNLTVVEFRGVFSILSILCLTREFLRRYGKGDEISSYTVPLPPPSVALMATPVDIGWSSLLSNSRMNSPIASLLGESEGFVEATASSLPLLTPDFDILVKSDGFSILLSVKQHTACYIWEVQGVL